MAKIKKIPLDIYKRDIAVFIGSSEELLKYAKKKLKSPRLAELVEEDDVDYAACCYHIDCGQSLIHLPSFPTTPEDISNAGHEALHATFNTLSYCGVNVTGDGDEAFTYLFGWILKNILDKHGYERFK